MSHCTMPTGLTPPAAMHRATRSRGSWVRQARRHHPLLHVVSIGNPQDPCPLRCGRGQSGAAGCGGALDAATTGEPYGGFSNNTRSPGSALWRRRAAAMYAELLE